MISKLAFLMALTISAQVFAAKTVLLESKELVGFAPPEYVGTYTTQIKSDGTIQYVDNKNKVIVSAKLSTKAVKQLIKEIATLEEGPLLGDEGPQCMDAPIKEIIAYKEDGRAVKIKTIVNCNTKTMNDATQLNMIIESAETLTTILTR